MTDSKRFEQIRDEYAFFEAHATEAEADLQAYALHLKAWTTQNQPLRMLDFGCGSGGFTARFLPLLPDQNELRISLVEPDDVYRQQAIEQVQAFTPHPVQAWSTLPPHLEACFDLILANHVFYYVPDLDASLFRLLRSVANSGLFLTAIADQKSLLVQFWNHCFTLLGKPMPYQVAEDLEAALKRQGATYRKQEIQHELAFPDSPANRLKILQFLLGSDRQVPLPTMLNLFDPYACAGQIQMPLSHQQFVVLPGKDPKCSNSADR